MTKAKNKKKRWSYSVGEKGRNRVRAYAHADTGRMFLEFSQPSPGDAKSKVKRVALGHRDEERAKEAAEKLAATLRRSEPLETEHVALAALFDNYLKEVTPQKCLSKQKHDRMCAGCSCARSELRQRHERSAGASGIVSSAIDAAARCTTEGSKPSHSKESSDCLRPAMASRSAELGSGVLERSWWCFA